MWCKCIGLRYKGQLFTHDLIPVRFGASSAICIIDIEYVAGVAVTSGVRCGVPDVKG